MRRCCTAARSWRYGWCKVGSRSSRNGWSRASPPTLASSPCEPVWPRRSAWTGRTDEAAAIVREAIANRLDDVPWDPARTHALARFTEAAVAAGTSDAYALLYEALEPFADDIVCSGAGGSGLSRTYLGMLAARLGRHEQADVHFGVASAFHRLNKMPLWEARSELAWAQALAERGETEGAHAHAARALKLAREHGYGAFEPRAAAILGADVGARP